jgi:hypothetical protein
MIVDRRDHTNRFATWWDLNFRNEVFLLLCPVNSSF